MFLQITHKRCLAALTALSLLLTISTSFAGNTYTPVEQEYLKTFAAQATPVVATDVADIESNKKLTFNKPTITEYEQRALALELLKEYERRQIELMIYERPVIDTKFTKKMELLCGSGAPEQHLLSRLSQTQTLFGELALAGMLLNPTSSQAKIAQRQTFIKGIVESELDAQELDVLFASVRSLETDILTYWQTPTATTQQLYDRLYFGNGMNFMNGTAGLELKTRLRNLGNFVSVTWPILPSIAITAYKKGRTTQVSDITDIAKDFVTGFYPLPVAYKDKSLDEVRQAMHHGQQPKSFGDDYISAEILAENVNQQYRKQGINFSVTATPFRVITGLSKAAFLGYYAWGLNKAREGAQLNTTTTDFLHKRLINLATYIETIRTIHAQLATVPGSHAIPAFATLDAYLNNPTYLSPEVQNLLSMLNTSTFKGEPSFFTLTGRVLAAHKLMEQVKNELAPFFEAAGQLEAYYSVAKLYAAHIDTKAHFCFVDFAHNDKPYINAQGFWNPFINANTVVTNNIEIDNNDVNHNVILTGPNTGGKSTVIKAVALNLLLAQTFGIAAADAMTITPFAVINCYLNITDDISSGTSLFHAEILRAKELVNQVKALEPQQFCFTILDEVFSGTNAEGGSQSAYQFAHELGQHANTVLVIATHFENMTELEKTSTFTNMSVTAKVLPNGTIDRPFKLETGAFRDPNNTILKALLQQEGIFAEHEAH